MRPVVELVLHRYDEDRARAAVDGSADAGRWPLRLVRRGALRARRLELADRDAAGCSVLEPEARSRIAETVRLLVATFGDSLHVIHGRDRHRRDVEVLDVDAFADHLAAHGLAPERRYVVTPVDPHPRRPAPSVAGPDAVDAAWDRVERWLDAYHPAGAGALRPGASAEKIQRAEAAIGSVFPPALRRWFARHDGQTGDVATLAEGFLLLDLAEVVDEHRLISSVGAEYQDDQWWSDAWIPFAVDGAGQALCVDTANGGRVMEFVHDGDSTEEAADLAGWATRWADELEAGEQVLDDGAVDLLRF